MNWHEEERATVFGGIAIAALCLFVYYGMIAALWDFSTLQNPTGTPMAPDFANAWSASKLALSGKAALAYNIRELHGVQLQALGSCHFEGSGWYYPPTGWQVRHKS